MSFTPPGSSPYKSEIYVIIGSIITILMINCLPIYPGIKVYWSIVNRKFIYLGQTDGPRRSEHPIVYWFNVAVSGALFISFATFAVYFDIKYFLIRS